MFQTSNQHSPQNTSVADYQEDHASGEARPVELCLSDLFGREQDAQYLIKMIHYDN